MANGESCLELGDGVLDTCAGIDAGGGKQVVARKRLKKIDGLLEEVGNFFSWSIVWIASRFEGGHAGSVLAPLFNCVS